MNDILALREKRAALWDAAKKYRDTHIDADGAMNAEDAETYDRMVDNVDRMKKEIDRLERQEVIENEMNRPVSQPIVNRPDAEAQARKPESKAGRASDAYKGAFWHAMRDKVLMPDVRNALQVGTESEGGYLVPDQFEARLVDALQEENIIRGVATIIQTESGERKIPIVASHGTASWVEEEGTIPESDDAFGQINLGAHKLATMIKISDELLQDSVFDMESYIAAEFGRRIGSAEESAFITGDGTAKPIGLLHDTAGAQLGVTSTGTAFTADEVIDLVHSVRSVYRKNAMFLMNDSTIKALRKLKDGNGNYLWQPGLREGQPDMLLNHRILTSQYMPEVSAGSKVMLFGDFKYYWIADRQGRSFQRLSELYAATGQIGFRATQRVDGRLILPETVKYLQIHA